uniref:Uncharacterized protein n=1 Tax=uncultured marine virus TaxID=186617 RepID=A0A0F7L3M8_9VIRU|nr:hypothetical protein [uncultured marine virus]
MTIWILWRFRLCVKIWRCLRQALLLTILRLRNILKKKSPDWGLDRTQFSSPTGQPAQAPMTGGAGGGDPTQAMTQQLSAAV